MTEYDRFESAYRECFPVVSSMQADLFERDDDGYIEAKVHTAFTLWKAASSTPADHHFDDRAVDEFARLMKQKMAASRAKGRGGWDDPNVCSVESLSAMLHEHVGKGDPVDVANFCMMLRHYDVKIDAPASPAASVLTDAQINAIYAYARDQSLTNFRMSVRALEAARATPADQDTLEKVYHDLIAIGDVRNRTQAARVVDYFRRHTANEKFDAGSVPMAIDGSVSDKQIGSVHIDHFRRVGGMENVTFDYFGDLPDGTHAVYAAPQAATRDAPIEVIQYQHRYVGDPRQRGVWENSRNIDWAKRIWEECEDHIDPVNKWEVRALCLAASAPKEKQ